uniref:Uncharacterized protein n=1 Tax=Arundo donax TaxID=35708 RepID=A0A0A9AK31_ARUDO
MAMMNMAHSEVHRKTKIRY